MAFADKIDRRVRLVVYPKVVSDTGITDTSIQQPTFEEEVYASVGNNIETTIEDTNTQANKVSQITFKIRYSLARERALFNDNDLYVEYPIGTGREYKVFDSAVLARRHIIQLRAEAEL